jgi:hypothetical protein
MASINHPLACVPAASGEIDWDLLLLLARTEAALTWPDEVQESKVDLTIPAGLDLRQPGDLDWVSRVVERAGEPLPPMGPAGLGWAML